MNKKPQEECAEYSRYHVENHVWVSLFSLIFSITTLVIVIRA